jgi:methylthioribulose-1-phosphate dehydratase
VSASDGAIVLEGFEMHKALNGITTHESTVRVPIFANAQDTDELARTVEASIAGNGVPGYLLAGHGLYAWGETMEQARRHVEGLEFLLRCSLEERRVS